ncbi:Mitochondrial import inner membrane translocase subunit TIM50 [Platanthera guangdongensis]|uniref:Mitochondrial import inner membrane translocase subunit TIM50 n=1 Tax=Platanthera guangdongensis TaxID=2320717 RepID=A0ABR2M009_9ASPA
MVSKNPKKNLTKSSKHSPKSTRRRPGKRSHSPLKSLTSAATSINRSFRSCRRRFVKILASISVFHTPNKLKQGFRRLDPAAEDTKSASSPPASTAVLPPPSTPGRKTVFLDLDETLIHSCTGIPPERYDFTVRPKIDGQEIIFYVLRRPGAEELLRAAAESFEVVIFTAGLKEYASLVLDKLDPDGALISHRLYRDSCREAECGRLMKDLSGLGRDLGKVVIVDDNPASYALQKDNAVPVVPFVDDPSDRELIRVIEFLNFAASFEDMRTAVSFFLRRAEERGAG